MLGIILIFLQAQSIEAVDYRLHLCRKVRHSSTECSGFDIKQPDGEAPDLEIWGICSILLLPLLPGPLWPGVVAPDRVLSMGQIEQTMCKQMSLTCDLYNKTWNHLPVCKKSSGSFKNVIYKMCL